MVRALALYGRPSDPAAFDRYYQETHIPKARRIPGLRRYTISAAPQAVEGESPYHLVAELDFDDLEAFQGAMSTPEGQATVNDLANFATGGVTILVCDVEDVTG